MVGPASQEAKESQAQLLLLARYTAREEGNLRISGNQENWQAHKLNKMVPIASTLFPI